MLQLTTMFQPKIERTRGKTPPGMAHWATTGPQGARCMDCRHFGLEKDSKIGTAICLKYQKMMGRKGKKIPKQTAACKYFEAH